MTNGRISLTNNKYPTRFVGIRTPESSAKESISFYPAYRNDSARNAFQHRGRNEKSCMRLLSLYSGQSFDRFCIKTGELHNLLQRHSGCQHLSRHLGLSSGFAFSKSGLMPSGFTFGQTVLSGGLQFSSASFFVVHILIVLFAFVLSEQVYLP